MAQGKSNWMAVTAAVSMLVHANSAHAVAAGGPAASPASPVMRDDGKLTCPQILSEAMARNREFDALLKEADRLKIPMSARTKALFAAHEMMASTLPLMGAGSDLGTQIAAAASTHAYMESAHADERKLVKPLEQRIEFAMARGDYLNDLHWKKCAKRASYPDDQSTGGAALCNARQTEIDRLRKQMEAGVASITGMAQSYKPGQAKAGAKVAGMAANLASALVPGIGGLLGDTATAAASAAQKAQFEGFHGKLEGMAQEQALLGQRISELEIEYEEKCER